MNDLTLLSIILFAFFATVLAVAFYQESHDKKRDK
jgi:hypothetical protein